MLLTIDAHYYNKLDIEGFSRMMKDPSYCYKFYWLEAIVQLISENRCEASYDEIIDEIPDEEITLTFDDGEEDFEYEPEIETEIAVDEQQDAE